VGDEAEATRAEGAPMSDYNPNKTWIDPVNWREFEFPAANGTIKLGGITVRALRAALEKADPDAMVTYIFEGNDQLNFGVIAAAGFDNEQRNICVLFGPEGVRAIKALGLKEL
jgi:hypothetical protein